MPPPSAAAAAEADALAATFDDLVSRAVEAGISSHAELPARVRALLPASEWRARCRALLVRRGAAWGASAAARGCCGEREYYEALVKYYLEAKRVYPYHLAHFVARVLRVTPPSFYASMLNATLRSGEPFASLPNFAAADAERTLGVGRNEFISTANAAAASAAPASAPPSNPLGGDAPSTPSPSSSSSIDDSGRRAVAAASRRGRAALGGLFSAAAAAAAGGGGAGIAAAPSFSAAAAASERFSSSSSSFSATPPGFPPAAAPWWRAHAVNVGEAEAASLSPEELGAARAAAAPGGVALSEVGFLVAAVASPSPLPPAAAPPPPRATAIEALYRRGIVYLSVPLTPEDSVSVPPLEGFVSNRGGVGGAAGRRRKGGRSERGGGGGGGGEQGGLGSSSDDDDGDGGGDGEDGGDEGREADNGGRGEGGGGDAAASDEDPVEPLLYALLVAAGGDDDDEGEEEEEEEESEDAPNTDGESASAGAGGRGGAPSSPMTVRRLAEEILGLDLGAALAAASLAVRLGFARRGRGRGGRGGGGGRGAAPRPAGGGGGGGSPAPPSPPTSRPPPPPPPPASAIALVVDAAVTSSLMAGALSPGLKTHAVSLFEGGRVGGRRAVADLLRELDATGEAAARFGAEGGIAELAADAAALAVVVRALQASGRERGGGAAAGAPSAPPPRAPPPQPPRVELLRLEALETSLPRGAAARLLCSQYAAVVSVSASASSPATPLGIRVRGAGGGAARGGAGRGRPPAPQQQRRRSVPLFLGPCPAATCSPLFSHALLWALCGRGPAGGAVALPSGLVLRGLPRPLEGAAAAALWCWRGGGDGGGREGAAAPLELWSRPRPRAGAPAAPRGPPLGGAGGGGGGCGGSDALLGGARIARSPRLLRALNDALASRRSLGGGVLAVPLPAAAAAALAAEDGWDSHSGLAAGAAASPSGALSFADVALPLSPAPASSLAASSPPPPMLEAVDPATGERVAIRAPRKWGEAAEEMALSSCVGVVRFCRFSGGGSGGSGGRGERGGGGGEGARGEGGEKEGEGGSSSSWFPLGIHLGIPLSPRPTCDAVCAALAASDLLSPAGVERAKLGAERRAEALGRFLESTGGDPSSSGLLLLSQALAFDGKEARPAAAASGSGASGGRGAVAAAVAVLGRRCLQAPGAVFEV